MQNEGLAIYAFSGRYVALHPSENVNAAARAAPFPVPALNPIEGISVAAVLAASVGYWRVFGT